MIEIEEKKWKEMCSEVENQRLTKQQLKRKIVNLTKIKNNHFEALKEIYSICLNQGKHIRKIELIKEICRKYKIPKRV